jgi:membrane-associated protease RseP (regulator of RpoE activity)
VGPDAFDEEYAETRPERYWLHALLLLLTLLSTTVVGARYALDFSLNQPPFPGDYLDGLWEVLISPALLAAGLPFSLTLLTILSAHEMGHYIACVLYRVDASLPYYLPVPTPIGTMGAFIRIRSPIYSKAALFDIGIAGPLAGFLFLLPALAIGLAWSKVIPGISSQGFLIFGTPLLQYGLSALIFPGVPAGDIYLHPVARAAWVGVLATALNLLPIGQLDGGHILYAFAGTRHRLLSRVFVGILLAMGLVLWWTADHVSWIVWSLLLLFFGMRHPLIHDWRNPGPWRAVLAVLALAIFIGSFCLIPLSMAPGAE